MYRSEQRQFQSCIDPVIKLYSETTTPLWGDNPEDFNRFTNSYLKFVLPIYLKDNKRKERFFNEYGKKAPGLFLCSENIDPFCILKKLSKSQQLNLFNDLHPSKEMKEYEQKATMEVMKHLDRKTLVKRLQERAIELQKYGEPELLNQFLLAAECIKKSQEKIPVP